MDVTPWLSMRQVCFPSHSWAFLETYSFFLSWLPYSPRYAGHITVIFLVINTYWTYTFTAKLNISSVTLQPSVPKLQCLPLKKGNKCIHASWGFKGEFGSCDLRILHFTASMFSDMKMSKHFELYKYVFLLMAVNGGLWVEAENTFFSPNWNVWMQCDDEYKNRQHCVNKT